MSAKRTSRRTSRYPSKDTATSGGRDTREGAHDDKRTATQSNPPNHGLPTHGPTRFLWEAPSDTPLDELGDLWERWNDDTVQLDFSEVAGDE